MDDFRDNFLKAETMNYFYSSKIDKQPSSLNGQSRSQRAVPMLSKQEEDFLFKIGEGNHFSLEKAVELYSSHSLVHHQAEQSQPK
ncbi:hypothetical protein [Noviherbaspirillum soli]|uniref:hypothetical protein n=1 Tax=Noviherbaspirillum soli TaxID=1064518 RepID=UPI00188AC2D5|nr:hypothetical protein [Noviherbaspirillum soli]